MQPSPAKMQSNSDDEQVDLWGRRDHINAHICNLACVAQPPIRMLMGQCYAGPWPPPVYKCIYCQLHVSICDGHAYEESAVVIWWFSECAEAQLASPILAQRWRGPPMPFVCLAWPGESPSTSRCHSLFLCIRLPEVPTYVCIYRCTYVSSIWTF